MGLFVFTIVVLLAIIYNIAIISAAQGIGKQDKSPYVEAIYQHRLCGICEDMEEYVVYHLQLVVLNTPYIDA
jgi:hypothetical protein